VGFKWFVPGLLDGTCCFGGEESAGASFLRRDGSVWTTDKDGPILNLLAAEITARTDRDPGEHYRSLAARPSGTEEIYRIYAESFEGAAHLDAILREARGIVNDALAGGGA
jgi:phosphoglucomutase